MPRVIGDEDTQCGDKFNDWRLVVGGHSQRGMDCGAEVCVQALNFGRRLWLGLGSGQTASARQPAAASYGHSRVSERHVTPATRISFAASKTSTSTRRLLSSLNSPQSRLTDASMSLGLSRALLRRQFLSSNCRTALRRPASTVSEAAGSAAKTASDVASTAKEKVAPAASKASEGLTRVASQAGNYASQAGAAAGRVLGGVSGTTGRIIGAVQGKQKASG